MTDGDLVTRPACPEDVDAVLLLWRRAQTLATVTDRRESVELLLDHDPDALLVAERSGRLVGSLIAGWNGWRGSFYRLAVDPDERRRGVASALLAAGERRLRSRGARRVDAIVAADEEAAAAFWSAAGYERQPDRWRFVRTF